VMGMDNSFDAAVETEGMRLEVVPMCCVVS
jgi:hypothetical protein